MKKFVDFASKTIHLKCEQQRASRQLRSDDLELYMQPMEETITFCVDLKIYLVLKQSSRKSHLWTNYLNRFYVNFDSICHIK